MFLPFLIFYFSATIFLFNENFIFDIIFYFLSSSSSFSNNEHEIYPQTDQLSHEKIIDTNTSSSNSHQSVISITIVDVHIDDDKKRTLHFDDDKRKT